MSSISQKDIEGFDISNEEQQELLKFEQNVVDFVIGLKRLSKDTGVSICGSDSDCACIYRLPSNDISEISHLLQSYIAPSPIGVVSPKQLIFAEHNDHELYKL